MKNKNFAVALIFLVVLYLSPTNILSQRSSHRGKRAATVVSGDFVTDSFTSGSDVNLTSHTPEVGGAWVSHASYSGTFTVNSSTGRVFSGTAAATLYYNNTTPPNANYYVQMDFCNTSSISQNIALSARGDTASDTEYIVRLNSGSWQMRKIISGSATDIASSVLQTPAVGNCSTGKFILNGNQLSFEANGVEVISPTTDNSITIAGKVGIRNSGQASSSTGVHVDNFSARGL